MLLNSDHVAVKSENTVYHVLRVWLDCREEDERNEVLPQLFDCLGFNAMSSDFVSWHIMPIGSLIRDPHARLLFFSSLFAMHGCSCRDHILQELDRRPGTRWGHDADFQCAEAVWDLKLEDVRKMDKDFLGCPVQFLIDGFVISMPLHNDRSGLNERPALVLYLLTPDDKR